MKMFTHYPGVLIALALFTATQSVRAADIEPNNDISNPRLLLESIKIPGISGDQDWYAITTIDHRITIDLEFKHKDADLDLFLYDSSGNLVQSSTTRSNDEKILFSKPYLGVYFILVDSNTPYNNTYYKLSWANIHDGKEDDHYEPNNDMLSAVRVNNPSVVNAISIDPDWYKFQVTEPRIYLKLSFDQDSVDLDLYLYDSSANLVNYSTSRTGQESIEIVTPVAGPYFVLVDPYKSLHGAKYKLCIGTGACNQNSAGAGAFGVYLLALMLLFGGLVQVRLPHFR